MRSMQLIVCSLAIAAAAAVLPLKSNAAEEARASTKVRLSIDDPRPLAKAVAELRKKYGYLISYEDPRYEYAGDMKDVTLQVRKDLDKYPPGQAPKVLIPAGGKMDMSYLVLSSTGKPANPAQLLQKMLDSQRSLPTGGNFALRKEGDVYQVVPARARNASGEWGSQTPVLDARIMMPPGERSAYEFLNELCEQIARATGQKVLLVSAPLNLLANSKTAESSQGEPARDVLLRVTRGLSKRLVWDMLYDPGLQIHCLNLILVSEESGGPEEQPAAIQGQPPLRTSEPKLGAFPGQR